MKSQLSRPRRDVLVRDDQVVKIQEPGASRRERLRTLAGQKVGQRTGLFVVPEIVSFDDSRGEIVFQRLRMTPLHQAVSDPGRCMELVGRAAGALAVIHGQLESNDRNAGTGAGERDITPDRISVPLHGDFGLRNIFCIPDSDSIAVIDWANTDWLEIDADVGAPEIDVAVFLVSLFHRRLFGSSSVTRRREVARHFLATYASAAPHGLELDTLRAVVAATVPGLNRQLGLRKGRIRALSYRYAMIDLELFLRRLTPQRLTPMNHPRTALPYTERHKARGQDYDETFAPEVNPYRAMLWRLEQRALDGILQEHVRPRTPTLLDFACGTGRILGHFAGRVASATGVDVSSSMMELARNVAPGAELIEADVTQQDVLNGRDFDLITAFRFFPNAEPELRRSAMLALARHLAPRGVLVFNNHKNRSSLPRRISRLLGRKEVTRGTMSHDEVEVLVAQAGLRILSIIPLGSLPVSEYHLLLPVWMLEPLERWTSRFSALAPLAQDVIYVCARSQPQRG